MIWIYKFFVKFLQAVLNFLFVIQITLMILVFLTASYWFCDLIGLTTFEFAAPLSQSISEFIRYFFRPDIEVGGLFIDGSLLIFDILALGFVLLFAKLKYYVYKGFDILEIGIENCKQRRENKFNRNLEKEVHKHIKKVNNAAVLVRFNVKYLVMDVSNKDPKQKIEEAFKIFYASIKNIQGCKFAKTDDKMLILLDNFENIDNLLHFVDMSINRIRKNMKQKHWALLSYIAVESFDDNVDFKEDVYPVLEKLIGLKHKNEIICFGNFCIRYNLQQDAMYTLFKKGLYNIGEEVEIWSLVKKN